MRRRLSLFRRQRNAPSCWYGTVAVGVTVFHYTERMKMIAQLKLQPTPAQALMVLHTLERANAACDSISRTAWTTKTFRQFDLHKLCYADVRETFGLASQVAVRCVSKVADAYKRDRKCQRTFRPHGAIAYDDRILSWNLQEESFALFRPEGPHRDFGGFFASGQGSKQCRTREEASQSAIQHMLNRD